MTSIQWSQRGVKDEKKKIHLPDLVSVVDMSWGIFEVWQHSLERAGAQLGVQPLVIEEHVCVEVLEASRSY